MSAKPRTLEACCAPGSGSAADAHGSEDVARRRRRAIRRSTRSAASTSPSAPPPALRSKSAVSPLATEESPSSLSSSPSPPPLLSLDRAPREWTRAPSAESDASTSAIDAAAINAATAPLPASMLAARCAFRAARSAAATPLLSAATAAANSARRSRNCRTRISFQAARSSAAPLRRPKPAATRAMSAATPRIESMALERSRRCACRAAVDCRAPLRDVPLPDTAPAVASCGYSCGSCCVHADSTRRANVRPPLCISSRRAVALSGGASDGRRASLSLLSTHSSDSLGVAAAAGMTAAVPCETV